MQILMYIEYICTYRKIKQNKTKQNELKIYTFFKKSFIIKIKFYFILTSFTFFIHYFLKLLIFAWIICFFVSIEKKLKCLIL
jgi:hypothetical protein